MHPERHFQFDRRKGAPDLVVESSLSIGESLWHRPDASGKDTRMSPAGSRHAGSALTIEPEESGHTVGARHLDSPS